MKRLTLAAAVGLAYASAAWGQAPPSGTYQFVSGPGAGTPPFTVTGFSTSLGGSIGLTHLPNCGGLHVHGMFNGFADPNSGGCGHGIISLVQSAIPGASSMLPGSIPGSAAGMLALTHGRFKIAEDESPRPADRIFMTYNYYNDAPRQVPNSEIFRSNFYLTGMYGADRVIASDTAERLKNMKGLDATPGRQFIGDEGDLVVYFGPRISAPLPTDAIDQARYDWAREDLSITLFGTPKPTLVQLRDGPPKPPATPGANPPAATPEPPTGSILDTLEEPPLREVRGGAAPAPKPPAPQPTAEEKLLDQAAQDIADGLFSGNPDKGKAAATALGYAPKDLQNRVVRQINERVQKIVNDAVRASTTRAAQPALSSAQMHAADIRIRWGN